MNVMSAVAMAHRASSVTAELLIATESATVLAKLILVTFVTAMARPASFSAPMAPSTVLENAMALQPRTNVAFVAATVLSVTLTIALADSESASWRKRQLLLVPVLQLALRRVHRKKILQLRFHLQWATLPWTVWESATDPPKKILVVFAMVTDPVASCSARTAPLTVTVNAMALLKMTPAMSAAETVLRAQHPTSVAAESLVATASATVVLCTTNAMCVMVTAALAVPQMWTVTVIVVALLLLIPVMCVGDTDPLARKTSVLMAQSIVTVSVMAPVSWMSAMFAVETAALAFSATAEPLTAQANVTDLLLLILVTFAVVTAAAASKVSVTTAPLIVPANATAPPKLTHAMFAMATEPLAQAQDSAVVVSLDVMESATAELSMMSAVCAAATAAVAAPRMWTATAIVAAPLSSIRATCVMATVQHVRKTSVRTALWIAMANAMAPRPSMNVMSAVATVHRASSVTKGPLIAMESATVLTSLTPVMFAVETAAAASKVSVTTALSTVLVNVMEQP